MTIDRFDRRIQFRRATQADDGLGIVATWEDHGTPIWAGKGDISDSERLRAGEVAAQITTRFRVRSSAFTRALTAKDRLVCDGVEYDISGVKEIGRRYKLEITATARAD